MDRTVIKRTLFRVLRPWPAAPARRAILTYHSVGGGPLALSVEQFAAQMRWLARNTRVVSLETLLGSDRPGESCVAITFDDGYASVADNAANVMQTLGFVGTVFATAGWIGLAGRRRSNPEKGHYPGEEFMTWRNLRDLRAQGWTIGSHGVEHDDLTALPAERVERELVNSRIAVADRVGAPCEHFAYTWGYHDLRVRNAVERAGYRSASSTVHGPLKRDSDSYALPRMDVTPQYTLEDFAEIVRGEWDWLGQYQRARGFVRRLQGGRS